MTDTPLYDALRALSAQDPLRMHMPGHKGGALPMAELSAAAPLDFTELPPTGNLFEEGGPIQAAEERWAAAFHMAHALFLTGGSTQGVHAALTLCASRDGRLGTGRPAVLLDRGSHRSAYHSLGLLDLEPVYLSRPWLEHWGVTGPIDPAAVDAALQIWPDIKTVCITSPTYYGILSDIPAIAAVCHAHGALLAVDGAHGAHLPFLGDKGYAAADVVVVSAHKTLAAPGQAAVLLAGTAFSQAELCRAGSLYGSSSPSYLLMAAMDCARAWMEGGGLSDYRLAAEQVARLRRAFPALDGPGLDPTRLTLRCGDGFALKAALERDGIYPEMADLSHVVFILTGSDKEEHFTRLSASLARHWKPGEGAPCPPPPQLPKLAMTPRQALFAPAEHLPLEAAEGRISAQQIAPYPPGVPVVAPGEIVAKKHLAYLAGIGYNSKEDILAVL